MPPIRVAFRDVTEGGEAGFDDRGGEGSEVGRAGTFEHV